MAVTSKDASARRRPRPRSNLRPAIAWTGLLLYLAVVLLATMWPTPLDQGYGASIERVLAVLHRNGVPEWFGYTKLEFSANIAMFIPLGFLLGLVVPAKAWWVAALCVPALSAAIEGAQSMFLSERFATVLDVVANTAGGWLGLLIAVILRALVYRRDEIVIRRALWDRERVGAQRRVAGANDEEWTW